MVFEEKVQSLLSCHQPLLMISNASYYIKWPLYINSVDIRINSTWWLAVFILQCDLQTKVIGRSHWSVELAVTIHCWFLLSTMPIPVNALFLILNTLWVLSTQTINLSQKVLLYFLFPNLKRSLIEKRNLLTNLEIAAVEPYFNDKTSKFCRGGQFRIL